jgi:hypothetical protein
VARYKHLSLDGIIEEMISCDRSFYSMPRILRRVWSSLWQRRKPLISLVGNFSYRNNLRLNRKAYADFKSYVKIIEREEAEAEIRKHQSHIEALIKKTAPKILQKKTDE